MIDLYIKKIKNEEMTIEDVPKLWKNKVEDVLKHIVIE